MKSFFWIFIFGMCIACVNSNIKENKAEDGFLNIKDLSKFSNLDSALTAPLKVKELRLRNRGFSKIPTEIFRFRNLEILDLSLNPIDSISSDIEKLTNLRQLSIAYGKLRWLSPSIGQLKNLEKLVLLENKINNVPESICNLDRIQHLNLTGNQLNDLPICICKLDNIKLLGLSYHKGVNHISKEKIEKIKACLEDVAVVFREMKDRN